MNTPRMRPAGRAGIRYVAIPAMIATLLLAGCSKPTTKTLYQDMARTGSPWFCTSQGGGEGGHADHLPPFYNGWVKGTLSPADCKANAKIFDTALAYVQQWPNAGAAKKAGFGQLVQHINGMGTHDARKTDFAAAVFAFDPGHPVFLQYDGASDNARIAGMSWFLMSGANPPEGFPGKNDWWHTHKTLCYAGAGNVVGNEISDAECTALKGKNTGLPGIWMSHAWIVPGYEDRHDVYAGAFNCVKGTGPAAPTDPCHNDFSDPEHATLQPTTPTTAPSGNPGITTTTHGDHAH